jgi:hypothetical protein
VSVVHHPLQTLRVALVVAGCAALLAGCGGSGDGSQRKVDYSMVAGVGASIRSANCRDWQKGSVLARRSTVIKLRKFAGGPVGSSAGIKNGPVLGDERAYQLFQSYCANHFARGFKLYKLYERAAAFIGH